MAGSDILTILPWALGSFGQVVVLLVMAWLLGRSLKAQATALQALVQALARQPVSLPAEAAPPAPSKPLPPAAPATPLTPAPTPAPSGPFAGAPAWFQWALHEIGTREEPQNRGPAIQRYIDLAHAGSQGDPWCAIFANAALEASGVPGSRSASSQSFKAPNFVALQRPALGALAVFWRGTPDSGLGHVGFYRGENDTHVWVLGGNESDMVQIEALPKTSKSFGLIGYWWPANVPLPTTGPVIMPAGSPVNVQADPTKGSAPATAAAPSGIQRSIIATMFGGASDPQTSAYTGRPITDTTVGVALPWRFSGILPKVRVTNPKTGQSIEADIVDVGPWNTNDSYWQTGTRPQAESGTDSRGRHTNGAGIDLTLAVAKALSIDGKGLVDWQFTTPPSTTAAPAVT